jgi:mortality factor 4-like protein 1
VLLLAKWIVTHTWPSRSTALLSEIIAGITLYFDKALGNNLLYRFERAQYVEQRRAAGDKPMSEIYGAEHLLRLFGGLQRHSLLC